MRKNGWVLCSLLFSFICNLYVLVGLLFLLVFLEGNGLWLWHFLDSSYELLMSQRLKWKYENCVRSYKLVSHLGLSLQIRTIHDIVFWNYVPAQTIVSFQVFTWSLYFLNVSNSAFIVASFQTEAIKIWIWYLFALLFMFYPIFSNYHHFVRSSHSFILFSKSALLTSDNTSKLNIYI